MSKTQVAERRPTEVQEMPDFGEDAGLGTQNASANELQTPFLSIAQANSKVLNRGEPIFIPEARAGDLYNTVTKDVYNGEEGVQIVPVYRQSLYTLWTPIEQGGGFHGTLPIEDRGIAALIAEQGKFPSERIRRGFDRMLLTEEGLQVVEQINLYALYGAPHIDDETFNHAVIAFTSTKIGVHRQFFTTVKSIRYGNVEPPFWAHRWSLSTISQKNSAGQPFFNYKLALAEGATPKNPRPALIQRTSSLYQAARAFYDMLNDGLAQANYASAADSEVAAEGTDAPF